MTTSKTYLINLLTLFTKLIAIAFLFISLPSVGFNLDKGIARSHAQWNSNAGTVRKLHNFYPDAIYIDENYQVMYGLSGTSIAMFDVSDNFRLMGGRGLTRWSHEYLEQKVEITYEAGNFYRAGDSDTYLADDAKLIHLMGCMQQTPLRYGDFTGDGKSELVVFLSDEVSTDIRVFSLDKQKVIFSSKLNFSDSEHRDDIPEYYLHDAPFQYLSWRHINSDIAAFPATKAYAKLYVDDFSNNNQQDLLVWRKVYQSRRLDDDIAGFELLEETLLHYSLVDGEYQPQEADAATIKGWLAANELTWQKGYPSKSECEGEEGELIPEMHDPLLNDPDVLQ
ncbi:hypothetical protein [Marinimicrobium sp. ABcell2]|uniref:hypothetical protein n=1 Tax=Marinimicrobium sp. ABcell2 TaxID=3069751 RepID=UPI0027B502F4|nr:hypothetical protein [Marinimicrobium sp. ABcell2]MDQ2075472.1 hypothetical protein [Marinimicrobium sp. ABcell2]